MNDLSIPGFAVTTATLVGSGLVLGIGLLAARYWRNRSPVGPVKGLLATSGALAVILGLALQSSLGDVFSGIVLDLERPYHVGDWVIVDDGVRGSVIETNWRSTHILTPSNDVAVLPNSLIAKSKLVNCSAPTRIHGVSLRVRLDASHAPSAGCNLLRDVLLGSDHILHSPQPTVTVLQLDADSAEYRQLLRHSPLESDEPSDRDAKGLVSRFAESIQRLFALH